jgi:hypothetical protein
MAAKRTCTCALAGETLTTRMKDANGAVTAEHMWQRQTTSPA